MQVLSGYVFPSSLPSPSVLLPGFGQTQQAHPCSPPHHLPLSHPQWSASNSPEPPLRCPQPPLPLPGPDSNLDSNLEQLQKPHLLQEACLVGSLPTQIKQELQEASPETLALSWDIVHLPSARPGPLRTQSLDPHSDSHRAGTSPPHFQVRELRLGKVGLTCSESMHSPQCQEVQFRRFKGAHAL